mmetsp:Transcript_5973/g.18368  ORF Transcript_5973/g.18368 Transcript_5973/m.18368 type:complete len:232 (-) Transcript_5973:1252-1947(-)|eukprot:scaffold137697_cov31-Tisochrysis_lutea.AAC.4
MSRSQPTQTLFLPELPADLSEAELERTFRGFVGFESCRLRNDRTGKLVGFVEFECVDDAVHARDSMQASSPFSGEPWNVQFSTNQNRGPAPKRLREDSGQSRHDVLRSNVGAPAVVPRPPYPTPPLPPGSKGSSLPALAPPPPIPPGYRVPTPPSLEPPPPLHYHVSVSSFQPALCPIPSSNLLNGSTASAGLSAMSRCSADRAEPVTIVAIPFGSRPALDFLRYHATATT